MTQSSSPSNKNYFSMSDISMRVFKLIQPYLPINKTLVSQLLSEISSLFNVAQVRIDESESEVIRLKVRVKELEGRVVRCNAETERVKEGVKWTIEKEERKRRTELDSVVQEFNKSNEEQREKSEEDKKLRESVEKSMKMAFDHALQSAIISIEQKAADAFSAHTKNYELQGLRTPQTGSYGRLEQSERNSTIAIKELTDVLSNMNECIEQKNARIQELEKNHGKIEVDHDSVQRVAELESFVETEGKEKRKEHLYLNHSDRNLRHENSVNDFDTSSSRLIEDDESCVSSVLGSEKYVYARASDYEHYPRQDGGFKEMPERFLMNSVDGSVDEGQGTKTNDERKQHVRLDELLKSF